MSVKLKRTSLPSVKILENKIQESESTLKSLLEVTIDTDNAQYSSLNSHIIDLKSAFKQYHSNVSALIIVQIENGYIADAKSLKDDRNMLRQEVNEVVALINKAFDDLEHSELATTTSISDSQPSNVTDCDVPKFNDVPNENPMLRVANFIEGSNTSNNVPDDENVEAEENMSLSNAHFASTNVNATANTVDNIGPYSNCFPTVNFLPNVTVSSNPPMSTIGISTTPCMLTSSMNFSARPIATPFLGNVPHSQVRPSVTSTSAHTFFPSYNIAASPYAPVLANPQVPFSTYPSLSHHPGNQNCNSNAYDVGHNNFFQSHVPPQPTLFPQHNPPASHFIPSRAPLYSATVGSNQPFNSNASVFHPQVQAYMDPASHHILRQNLLKKSDNPFNGESHHFQSFVNQINNKTKGINLDPWDKICILEAHTTGKPQKLIRSYMSNVSANPFETLTEIEKDLATKFGSGAKVVSSLLSKLDDLPLIKSVHNSDKLEELLEICKLIKTNMSTFKELEHFNFANGLHKIWLKLPESFQNSWRSVHGDFKLNNSGSHPPFAIFLNFLNKKCNEYSDPIYEKKFIPTAEYLKKTKDTKALKTTSTFKKGLSSQEAKEESKVCLLHAKSNHELFECKLFSSYSVDDKFKLMKEKGLCFGCLGKHLRAKCDQRPKCDKCGRNHLTILHRDQPRDSPPIYNSTTVTPKENVDPGHGSSLCTKVCGDENLSRSCSKTVLVDISCPKKSRPTLRCYAILDDHSDSSFADPKVAEHFNITGPNTEYKLNTLAGLQTTNSGILLSGLKIKGANESRSYHLPTLLTNPAIPEHGNEVASPAVVAAHPQIASFAKFFQETDPEAQTLLLLGRDFDESLYTRCFGQKAPFVHRTRLGWALVGNVCKSKPPTERKALRTVLEHLSSNITFSPAAPKVNELAVDCFKKHPDDEFPGNSRNDLRFLRIVSDGIHINREGFITMPLPWKDDSVTFPDNRQAVFNRASNTLNKIKRDEDKLQKCLLAMQNNIDDRHVERVSDEGLAKVEPGNFWYLPVFPVSNDNKDKIRLVFDGSAAHKGVSLNSQLLSGPDFINSLRSVLLKFRQSRIAFSADIASMFYCFKLNEEDKDKTRFFWFDQNDPGKELVEYRANVHLFGNTSSPALAITGLHFAVSRNASNDVRSFVQNYFYVDDALISLDTEEEAIDLLSETITCLSKYHIRLHKISSNSRKLLSVFPPSELSTSPENLGTCTTSQRTLGLQWNADADTLTIKTKVPDRPFTKRGILATTHSIFDPLGLVSPIILEGKLFQRMITPPKSSQQQPFNGLDWDDDLPEEHLEQWNIWKQSLSSADGLSVPRCIHPFQPQDIIRKELHAFCDASLKAIGYAIYQKTITEDESFVSLVAGNSKVTPKGAGTIPRLELCAAVDISVAASEIARTLLVEKDNVHLYSDSMIVLGYLSNSSKRFAGYVTRRIQLITSHFPTNHWNFVSTQENPADLATRPQDLESLKNSMWFQGPDFLQYNDLPSHESGKLPDELPETLGEVTTLKTTTKKDLSFCGLLKILQTTSFWKEALGKSRTLIAFAFFTIDRSLQRRGVSLAPRAEVEEDAAHDIILRIAQMQEFPDVFNILQRQPHLPKNHPLSCLAPFLDNVGVLRVGGRLRHSSLSSKIKHPIILPSSGAITELILRYYHCKSRHQGRVITQAAIRNSGFFIHKGSSTVKKFLRHCVTCQRLRGPRIEQLMNELPPDRLECTAPFTHCAMDVFGSYNVTDGTSTRRNNSSKKCWGLLFTCLVSRAVHIEALPSLDITAFKNAFRRFICLRGGCQTLRCDNGSNFIGAFNQDEKETSDLLQREFSSQNIKWIFNPPKASHFGGVFERKIGSVRKILDACMLQLGPRQLTRDEFTTFLAEASHIINNTPLSAVSSDPQDPLPITPATLLNLREEQTGPPLESFSQKDLLAYGPRRWRRIQHLSSLFWNFWQRDYIHTLQSRQKWKIPKRSLQPGDIVLIREKPLRRYLWPLARVKAVRNSADGRVRSATLTLQKHKNSLDTKDCTRPISQLVLLIPAS